MVLAAIRKRGVPLQRIRPALKVLTENIGLEHALASRALYTDGAEILYDYAETIGDSPEARSARDLVVFWHGQHIVRHGGARVADALQRFWAGEDLQVVAREFGIQVADLEDALRVASRRAACPLHRSKPGTHPSAEPASCRWASPRHARRALRHTRRRRGRRHDLARGSGKTSVGRVHEG